MPVLENNINGEMKGMQLKLDFYPYKKIKNAWVNKSIVFWIFN